MKRFFIATFVFFILISPTFAQNVEFKDENYKINELAEGSWKLKKEIRDAIIDIYGKEQADIVEHTSGGNVLGEIHLPHFCRVVHLCRCHPAWRRKVFRYFLCTGHKTRFDALVDRAAFCCVFCSQYPPRSL